MPTLLLRNCIFAVLMPAAFLVAANPLYGQAFATPSTAEAPPMATPHPVPDGRFHVQLKDGSLIVGRFPQSDPLKLKCVVGMVDIPLKEIGELHFAEDGACKVSFRNHDALSGKLQADSLSLDTSFGVARVRLSMVVAVISHEHSLGNHVIQRVIRNTEDGEKIQWQTLSAQPSAYSPYGFSPAGQPVRPATPSIAPAPYR